MLPFYLRDTDSPAKREILRAAMKLFSEHGIQVGAVRGPACNWQAELMKWFRKSAAA
jgi:hypothetical protein